ncbi:MAG: c-type cytochrome [Candidatus Binatia bacterium]
MSGVGRWRILARAGLVAAFVSISALAYATEADSPAKAAYLKYCSACHGESGKGDGVVSGFLRPKPTDLTQIAKNAGGRFPFAQVVAAIDGTTTVRAHGDADMPVWGDVFRKEVAAPIARHATVRSKVMLITEFVASIQEK